MVLTIRGYDPTEIGLRKFLTEPEREVLTCLWETGKDGCSEKALKRCLDAKGLRHSNATIMKTLNGLRERGAVGSRVVTRSTPDTEYFILMTERELTTLLVDQFVASLNDAMPEAVAYSARKLGL